MEGLDAGRGQLGGGRSEAGKEQAPPHPQLPISKATPRTWAFTAPLSPFLRQCGYPQAKATLTRGSVSPFSRTIGGPKAPKKGDYSGLFVLEEECLAEWPCLGHVSVNRAATGAYRVFYPIFLLVSSTATRFGGGRDGRRSHHAGTTANEMERPYFTPAKLLQSTIVAPASGVIISRLFLGKMDQKQFRPYLTSGAFLGTCLPDGRFQMAIEIFALPALCLHLQKLGSCIHFLSIAKEKG